MKRLFSLIFLVIYLLPTLSFAAKPHWISTQIVSLQGNTYNAFTPVTLSSASSMAVVRVRQNPPTGWINSCELDVSLVASPNTYTANYGYSSIPASTDNSVNERVFYNNSEAAYTVYFNLTQNAKALIEIDKFYLYTEK